LRAEVPFELSDVFAHHDGTKIELSCGGAEAAAVDGGHEHFETAQSVHDY
jgi:hypothetical protein